MTVWLIQLIDVLQPLSLLLASISFSNQVLIISPEGISNHASYITMLMLAILIVLSAGYFAYQQADNFLDDEERMAEYTQLLDERWLDLKETPLIGKSIIDAGATMEGTLDEDLASMGLLEEVRACQPPSTVCCQAWACSSSRESPSCSFCCSSSLRRVCFQVVLSEPTPVAQVNASYDSRPNRSQVNTYVVVKTGVGFGTGVCAGLVMLIFGIDLWFTWALLTFLLNYVPYIGSLLATIPPILLGFILLDPALLLLLTALLLTNQQLWGNIIETRWAGRALDISPVLLLVVTAFSFWVWGIIGMILSIPLVVILKIVLENIDATRPLAILLSERAPTLEEAWREAIKDGRITAYEERMLTELQVVLGYSDDQVKLISARIAAEYALRRGRLSLDQIALVRVGIAHMHEPQEWREQFEEIVTEGKLSVMERLFLGRLVFAWAMMRRSESKHFC